MTIIRIFNNIEITKADHELRVTANLDQITEIQLMSVYVVVPVENTLEVT